MHINGAIFYELTPSPVCENEAELWMWTLLFLFSRKHIGHKHKQTKYGIYTYRTFFRTNDPATEKVMNGQFGGEKGTTKI